MNFLTEKGTDIKNANNNLMHCAACRSGCVINCDYNEENHYTCSRESSHSCLNY